MGKLDALGISFDSDPRRDNPVVMPPSAEVEAVEMEDATV
jgi:hypothetical protein